MASETDIETIRKNHTIILFDGVCNLCNGFVQFLIERDSDKRFRFAPLQSEIGTELLAEFDLLNSKMDTMVVIEDDTYYTQSDAAIQIANHLGGIYRAGIILKYLPKFVRNRVYNIVSNNRYDWFGKKESCMRPSPDVKSRFLVDPTTVASYENR